MHAEAHIVRTKQRMLAVKARWCLACGRHYVPTRAADSEVCRQCLEDPPLPPEDAA